MEWVTQAKLKLLKELAILFFMNGVIFILSIFKK